MDLIIAYIAKKSNKNLEHGLKNGIWGFKDRVIGSLNQHKNKNTYLILGTGYTGGSPRTKNNIWNKNSLEELYISKITNDFYRNTTIEWEDEVELPAEKRYVWKFNFENTKVIKNIKLNELNYDISEFLRLSATTQSRGYLLENIEINDISQRNDIIETLNHYKSDKIEDIENINKTINKLEKDTIIKSRIGQSNYRKSLINKYKRCLVCGLSDERFLIASHIKPWSESKTNEKLDINNGLLLCVHHDSLFDKNFISFTDTGDIIISDEISKDTQQLLNININIKLKLNLNDKTKKYLELHRKKLLEKTLNKPPL